MADTPSQEGVGLTTKWFGLNLTGQSAGVTFIFITLLALSGLTLYEHIQRSVEHDAIACQIKLNLYMQTQMPDKPIDWRKMPPDLFGCIPKFFFERDQATR